MQEDRAFFGVQVEILGESVAVILREGYINPVSGHIFSREIEDDDEKVRYVCKRRVNKRAGIRSKIIEKVKDSG